MAIDYKAPLEELPVGCVASHFLDSGAFSQWAKSEEYAKKNKTDRWAYFHTPEFWAYIDAYAAFIKKHRAAIDLYANLDVIPNARLTWRNQEYLEDKHGLQPVPVVHCGTDLRWLRFYMERGYDIIGLGGLVGRSDTPSARDWLKRVFDMVCDGPRRLPKVKLHGFGITTYDLLIMFPWYSVDSASWTKVASFGGILVPHLRKGKWDFGVTPYLMKVSLDSPDKKKKGKHLNTLGKTERAIVRKWLADIQIPEGEVDHYGDVIKWGVTTHHTYRKVANLLFYERMRDWLPEYPWPYHSTRVKGFLY